MNASKHVTLLCLTLQSIADRLEAWAENSERMLRSCPANEEEAHRNTASNYRALIRQARSAIAESKPHSESTK